jgi:hypothetical protein
MGKGPAGWLQAKTIVVLKEQALEARIKGPEAPGVDIIRAGR